VGIEEKANDRMGLNCVHESDFHSTGEMTRDSLWGDLRVRFSCETRAAEQELSCINESFVIAKNGYGKKE